MRAGRSDDLRPDLLNELHGFLLHRCVHLDFIWRVEDFLHLLPNASLVAFPAIVVFTLDLGEPAWNVKILNILANTILLGRSKPVNSVHELFHLAFIDKGRVGGQAKLASGMQEVLLKLLGDHHFAGLEHLQANDKRVDLASMNAQAMAVKALRLQ